MSKNYYSIFNLNKLFQKLTSKKQYTEKLDSKIHLLYNIKEQNYKNLNFYLPIKNNNLFSSVNTITYTIYISFVRKNV